MEADCHYSRTACLAAQVMSGKDAELLAWANWMVDCATFGRVITQCSAATWLLPGAGRHIVQPFHFVPGGDGETCDTYGFNKRLHEIVILAGDLISLGIALHAVQDSWSHQGFVGGFSKRNSCFSYASWWRGLCPNFCHNDLVKLPDIYDAVWYDPRRSLAVDNLDRFDAAFKAVATILKTQDKTATTQRSYDKRKLEWEKKAGVRPFGEIYGEMWGKYGRQWQLAAAEQRRHILRELD